MRDSKNTTPWFKSIHGHVWTLAPFLKSAVFPARDRSARPWETMLLDPVRKSVRLTGWLRHRQEQDALVVIVHGLGGHAESPYVVEGANAVERAGLAHLRLNLRGATADGEDYYHAGLTADIEGALQSTDISSYRRIYLFGYSLGGHVVLRYASENPDPRVQAVAAVGAPLDLEPVARSLDTAESAIYRYYLLLRLKQMYAAVETRHKVPIPSKKANRIRTFAEWDNQIVAPRYGFRNAVDYWTQASVAKQLSHLQVPALFVYTRHDPMVRDSTVSPFCEAHTNFKAVCLDRGGHLGFPSRTHLGFGSSGSVSDQTVAWLKQH